MRLRFVFCLTVVWAAMGCAKQGTSQRDQALLVDQYEAESAHRERTSFRNVYSRLYESEESVIRYCGQPESHDEAQGDDGQGDDEEQGGKTWPKDCYKRLEKIFWARLKIAYPYTDWAKVDLECEAYPEKCGAPKGVELLVHASNREQSGKALEADFKRVRENYEFGDNDCIVTSFSVGSGVSASESTTTGTDSQTGQIYENPAGGGSVRTSGSHESETHGSSASSWASAGRTTVRCRTTERE